MWFYYDVTHALHRYCNPVSAEAVADLSEILELTGDSRVLDIACGMGEMLIEFHERYGATGVGVDLSPYALARARKRMASRVPGAGIELVSADGAEYEPDGGERFDVAMSIGASWIWNGYEGTLDALVRLAKPEGIVAIGEPFWIKEPPEGRIDPKEQAFFTLNGCHLIAKQKGLRLVWMREAPRDEWDRYEMLQTASFDRFTRREPGHPDLAEVRERLLATKDAYFEWEREHFGFAVWVFRTPPDDA